MNIIHFISDAYGEYNSSNFRCSIPATECNRTGIASYRIAHIRHWLKRTRTAELLCEMADVIIVQRLMIGDTFSYIEKWRTKGKVVILDFDDAYDKIRPDNAAYKFWGKGIVDVKLSDGTSYQKKMKPHPIEHFKEGLPLLSAITTPSRVLCSDWSEYTEAIHIPNYLDVSRYLQSSRRKERKTTIGWGGSLSHIPSFAESGVEEALLEILKERKDSVQLLICGDKRILDRFPPLPNILFRHYVRFTDWPSVLRRFDIGIAPLSGAYDQRRSSLKVAEYTTLKIPWVATKSAVYEDFFDSGFPLVDQGADITVCPDSSPDLWYNFLIDLIDNIDYYLDLSNNEFNNKIKSLDIKYGIYNILSKYKELI